jgi:DNA-binding SARP family transcriptional activator
VLASGRPMEFRILGPLEVISDGRALELGGQKQRALLAMLLLDANRVVSRGWLIDALWEDTPPDTVKKVLQVYVSQLRRVLGKERLQSRAPGYMLLVEPGELDLEAFERCHGDGRLQEALALWRGAPLAAFADHRFAQSEIARLDELRLTCLEERFERDLASGLDAELVGDLEHVVAEHPLRERLRGRFMLALYRAGRQADALEAYQDARRVLLWRSIRAKTLARRGHGRGRRGTGARGGRVRSVKRFLSGARGRADGSGRGLHPRRATGRRGGGGR